MKAITRSGIVKLLRARVRRHASYTAAAAHLQVSRQHLCDVLRGRRRPGVVMQRALGVRRISLEVYEPVRKRRRAKP